MISLDPGVRTFMTGYDPSGVAVEWGKNDIGRIYRLSHACDKLQSKRDCRCYVTHSQEDRHYNLAKWLVKTITTRISHPRNVLLSPM